MTAGISRITKRKPPKGSKGGAPSYAPTQADQELMLGLMVNGVSVHQAAAILKIDEKTLRKHFPEEIVHGREVASGKVASALFAAAIKCGSSHEVTAAIFFLKARAGWKDGYTISNPDGTNVFPEAPPDKLAALAGAAAEVLQRVGR